MIDVSCHAFIHTWPEEVGCVYSRLMGVSLTLFSLETEDAYGVMS